MRSLDGLRFLANAREPDRRAIDIRHLVRPQSLDCVQLVEEDVPALPRFDPVCDGLLRMRRGPDADDETAPAEYIKRRGGLREHDGVVECEQRDRYAEVDP